MLKRGPRKRLRIALVGVPLVAALLVSLTNSSAMASTSTAQAADDAYVRADRVDANFGQSASLQVARGVTAYLKFAVQGVRTPIVNATLRLESRATGTSPISVSPVADRTWSERTITSRSAPVLGARLSPSAPAGPAGPIAIDVSAVVHGDGTYSFAVTTASTRPWVIDAKESGPATAPELVLQSATGGSAAPRSRDPVLAVGGDIACATTDPAYNGGDGVHDHCHMRATAALIGAIHPDYLLMLGDGQYKSGTATEYSTSYAWNWGTYKAITKPTPGNHDYGTPGAAGYFSYFGNAATPRQKGCRSGCEDWSSFDVGQWHIIDLDTNCTKLAGGAGCARGSAQEEWLEADLEATASTRCTLVFGHHPRWSSNSSASADVAPLMEDMYAGGVDLYVAAHSHAYERFAPMNPAGVLDLARGVREIVVGTGGEDVSGFGAPAANSEKRANHIFGVAKLVLHATSYDLTFVNDDTNGQRFTDSTSGQCH